MLPRSRSSANVRRLVLLLAIAVAIPVGPARLLAQSLPAVGGFLELDTSTDIRPILTQLQIQALLPARGKFFFPAPYNTEGIRVTNAGDCGGADCVNSIGYSYWRNINNHVGSDTMLIFLGLDRSRGGGGPTLFRYDKITEEVTNLGPLFDASSPYSWNSGEGWYFSATQPTKLYVPDGPRLSRYDVLLKQFETVFDAGTQFGTDKYVWQANSSNDDLVHSATLRQTGTWAMLGCMVYREDTRQFSYFPSVRGDFDECQVDKSGRWLLIKENVDGLYGEDNRILDLQTGTETVLLDQSGAAGHSDNGYGYLVAADNWYPQPNAWRVWQFAQSPLQGSLVYAGTEWTTFTPAHVSHSNAQAGVPPEQQYACGSAANRVNAPRSNEIFCFRLDTSHQVLVVAPVLTDLNATGGGSDDYSKLPKGNLDVTGQYFIWTSNMAGGRQDAFIVRVPSQLLTGLVDTTPPTVSLTSPVDGATVSSTISVSANASDNVAVAGVQFRVDGVNVGAEVTLPPYSISWNTTTATNGSHTLTAVARDAAGNTGTSSPVSVTVSNDTTAPVISGVAVSNLSSSWATVTWTTSEPSDSQVEYGPTIAYGSLTPLDTTKVTAHAQTLSGLAAGALYHYRVKSRDAAGNLATSGDFTFTTLVPSDITPPSVSITAPASGSTVTGTVTISTSATDNVGIVGVQFKLDGANLGAEVTATPYAASWNTTTATNGSHTLTAVARDAAGNTTTSAGISVTVANAIAPPGVVGFWKLDEGSGTIAADSSGYGNTGTLMNGPVWTPGKLNQALSFEGADDYVDVPHAPVLNSYPLTVATWIKTNSTGLNNGIVNKYLPGSFNGFQVFMNAGNLCAWYFKDASNHTWDGTNCTLMTPGYNDNQWHHVALVVDAAGGRLYVDGMQTASQGWTGTPGTASTTQPLSIGRYPGTMSPFLPGLLDDVRIYNYALSASEVLSLSSASPLNSVAGVVWTDLTNVMATGNSLQKTGGCDGCPDAGGTSQQQILSGDAYLEFTASETGALRYAGLSTGNAGTSAEEIRFAVRLQSGIAEVRESGVYRADTPFVSGDVFRVAVESGVVMYSKNGTLFYQSTLAPTYPLLVDTSLASLNATITNAVISGALSTASIDTTPPTVAITAPAAGATVAGTVTLSASASDDVGVAAVQFKLDGANLGAEVTLPPYALSWVTTTAPNGSHTLTAVASDGARNSATSAPVTVTVSNDLSPPIISSVSAANISSAGAIIAWTTNEASDSQVEYGPTTSYGSTTPLDTNLVTVHSQALTGLARNTWYHYRVNSRDPAGNLAIAGDFVFKTTKR